jgi:hypothetical protein
MTDWPIEIEKIIPADTRDCDEYFSPYGGREYLLAFTI